MKSALATLVEKHVDDPSLAEIAPRLASMGPNLDRFLGEGVAEKTFGAMAKSKSAGVRGWACFIENKMTIEEADRDTEDYKTARKALLDAVDAAKDKALQAEVQGMLDLREKYGVGCVAPDIAGTDLEGVAFKLSDYKGKVVFVDFWGDW